MSEYKVIFAPSCRQKLERLVPSELKNELLETILNDLATDPFAFKSVGIVDDRGETSVMRYVKTELFLGETGFAPPMIFFFGIIESRKQVYIVDVARRPGFGIEQGTS